MPSTGLGAPLTLPAVRTQARWQPLTQAQSPRCADSTRALRPGYGTQAHRGTSTHHSLTQRATAVWGGPDQTLALGAQNTKSQRDGFCQ